MPQGAPPRESAWAGVPALSGLSFNVQEHQCPITQACQTSQRQSHTNETTDITARSQASSYLSYENNIIAKGTDKSTDKSVLSI